MAMRGRWGAVCVLLALALAAPVWGRDLSEILKEKGVLTAEEAQEAAATTDVRLSYKLGKGVTFETRDGRFASSLGSRLQFLYTYADRESRGDVNDFRVRRAKVWLKGHAFAPELTYYVQLDLADGDAELQDFYAAYQLHPLFGVQLGQFKPPQGRQELTSSGKLQLVERSEANDFFNINRDRGVQIGGEVGDGILSYAAGLFNGNGPNERNASTDLMYTGRLDFEPLGSYGSDEADLDCSEQPLVTLGGSAVFDAISTRDVAVSVLTDSTGAEIDRSVDFKLSSKSDLVKNFVINGLGKNGLQRDVDLTLWTANGGFKYRGFSVHAEGYFASSRVAGGGPDPSATGCYVQSGYFVLPERLELAMQYAWIDPDRELENILGTRDISVVRGGVSYYVWGHNLKIQADVGSISTRRVAKSTLDDIEARTQVQLVF